MDLALYLRVLWRFRIIVAAGFLLAVLLAFTAVSKVSFSGGSLKLTPRKVQTWKSDAFLQVTSQNFPLGRDTPAYTNGSQRHPSSAKGDPARLSYLTTVYSQLATNDTVIRQVGIDPTKPEKGTLTVTALSGPAYSNPAILNILDFTATGPTAERAVGLASRSSKAFQSWLVGQQERAGIAPDDRVIAQEYKSATPAERISSTGKTLPVIVFLTVFGATIGLALVLENLRPPPGRATRPGERDQREDLRVEHSPEPVSQKAAVGQQVAGRSRRRRRTSARKHPA